MHAFRRRKACSRGKGVEWQGRAGRNEVMQGRRRRQQHRPGTSRLCHSTFMPATQPTWLSQLSTQPTWPSQLAPQPACHAALLPCRSLPARPSSPSSRPSSLPHACPSPSMSGSPSSKKVMVCPSGMPGSTLTVSCSLSVTYLTLGQSSHTCEAGWGGKGWRGEGWRACTEKDTTKMVNEDLALYTQLNNYELINSC